MLISFVDITNQIGFTDHNTYPITHTPMFYFFDALLYRFDIFRIRYSTDKF